MGQKINLYSFLLKLVIYICLLRKGRHCFILLNKKNLCYANTFKWKLNLHLIVVFQTLFSQLLLPLKMFSHMQLFLSYIKFSICLQHTLPQDLKKKDKLFTVHVTDVTYYNYLKFGNQ